MPRARKLPGPPGDQAYGDKKRLDNALAATPGARQPPAPPGSGGPVPVPAASMPAGGVPPQVLAAAQAMAPPGPPPWQGPSRRPNEPVTAGIPSGPGPGPEALGPIRPDVIADTFEAIGDAIGDPLMYELANQARNYPGR